MSIVAKVDYAAKGFAQHRLRGQFMDSAPRLREMPQERRSPRISTPVVGKAYAIVAWSAGQLMAAADGPPLADLILSRLYDAASVFGGAVDQCLRGVAPPSGSYKSALEDAIQDGIGIAVEGIGQADPGDVFEHVGALPHLKDDDGSAAWRAESDHVFVVLRLFGHPRPGAAP